MLPELIQSKSRPPQETAGCIIEGGDLRGTCRLSFKKEKAYEEIYSRSHSDGFRE